MKTIAKPIQMVSWIDEKGDIHPIRFKLQNEDESNSVIKVDRVISIISWESHAYLLLLK